MVCPFSVEVTSFARSLLPTFVSSSCPPVTVYRKLLVLPSLLLALSSATVPIDKLRVLCICTLATPPFVHLRYGTVGTDFEGSVPLVCKRQEVIIDRGFHHHPIITNSNLINHRVSRSPPISNPSRDDKKNLSSSTDRHCTTTTTNIL